MKTYRVNVSILMGCSTSFPIFHNVDYKLRGHPHEEWYHGRESERSGQKSSPSQLPICSTAQSSKSREDFQLTL